ncbi:hypothetical protein Golob_006859, partial [Gossypium lobatum]|nr:hypothetical protein [Gossypium lobatum]
FKEIELYVEHEVYNPIIVDEIFLLTFGEDDVEGVEVDGGGDDERAEFDGECDLEKVEFGGKGDVGEVQADGEGVSATGIEDNDSEVVADEYVGDFATSDGVDNVADEYSRDEEDGNKTEVWNSDEHGSLVGSDEDEEHEDGERTKSKFPLYNDKLKFSLGMLFKDGKQFKSTIRKYSKECRRQLKFINNEPKRVVIRCIASPNCPWRIRASYNPVAKCLQIKKFQDEHYCS